MTITKTQIIEALTNTMEVGDSMEYIRELVEGSNPNAPYAVINATAYVLAGMVNVGMDTPALDKFIEEEIKYAMEDAN